MHKIDLSIFLVNFAAGGGERVLLDIGNQFSSEGKRVEFVVMNTRGALQDQVLERGNVVSLDANSFLDTFFKLRKYIQAKSPKTIIATTEHTNIILLLAKLTTRNTSRCVIRVGIPLKKQFSLYTSFKDKMIPFFSRMLYARADHIIAVSEGVKDEIVEVLRVPVKNISAVYHPKNRQAILAKGEEKNSHPWFTEGTPIIIATGRLRIQKGFAYLIEALVSIPDARLLILGSGSEKEELLKKAKTLGVSERVQFLGFVENPYAFISKANIFVLSSLWEGLPSALIEALILGVPSVAADCDYGPHEILDPRGKRDSQKVVMGEYGILVPPASSQALGEAIRALLADKELLAKYRKEAERRGGELSGQDSFATYKKILFG